MANQFRAFATDSMPERVEVTRELERRYKEQEEAKKTSQQTGQAVKTTSSQR